MSVRHGVALSVLVVVAGCSGESSVEERMFTTADARKLAQIRPANEEWGSPWPKHPIPPPTDPSSTGASAPADPVLAAIEAELAAVPSLDGAGNKWRDEGEKTANLVVGVHPTADDAKRFLAPFNDFSR